MDIFTKVVTIITGLGVIFGAVKGIILPIRKFIKNSNDNDEKLTKALDNLSIKVDNNERDRIRSEIFRMGHRARKGERIDEQEYQALCMDYEKYSQELHGNGIAEKEFDFVSKYYNQQFLSVVEQ